MVTVPEEMSQVFSSSDLSLDEVLVEGNYIIVCESREVIDYLKKSRNLDNLVHESRVLWRKFWKEVILQLSNAMIILVYKELTLEARTIIALCKHLRIQYIWAGPNIIDTEVYYNLMINEAEEISLRPDNMRHYQPKRLKQDWSQNNQVVIEATSDFFNKTWYRYSIISIGNKYNIYIKDKIQQISFLTLYDLMQISLYIVRVLYQVTETELETILSYISGLGWDDLDDQLKKVVINGIETVDEYMVLRKYYRNIRINKIEKALSSNGSRTFKLEIERINGIETHTLAYGIHERACDCSPISEKAPCLGAQLLATKSNEIEGVNFEFDEILNILSGVGIIPSLKALGLIVISTAMTKSNMFDNREKLHLTEYARDYLRSGLPLEKYYSVQKFLNEIVNKKTHIVKRDLERMFSLLLNYEVTLAKIMDEESRKQLGLKTTEIISLIKFLTNAVFDHGLENHYSELLYLTKLVKN